MKQHSLLKKIKRNSFLVGFSAVTGVAVVWGVVLGIVLWNGQEAQRTQAEQQLQQDDVFPQMETYARNQEIDATVVSVSGNQVRVTLESTGKEVPVNVTENTRIEQRIPREPSVVLEEKRTYYQQITDSQNQESAPRPPQGFERKEISVQELSGGDRVEIRPTSNAIGKTAIPARLIRVTAGEDQSRAKQIDEILARPPGAEINLESSESEENSEKESVQL